ICAAYEKALGKPFYYFLFYFDCQDASISREKCPVCGGDWMLEEKIGSISFKCDKCRLVSY
ncbi:MAG: Zn-ribbon-containing protein, partial [Defluviitaleaceae bacterium]|nr:Zn-ribbon-containing protein [Defluviitaleaceae bacterium]